MPSLFEHTNIVLETGPLDRLTELLSDLPVIVWETALNEEQRTTHFTFLSDSAERILGYSREYLLTPASWWDMVYPADQDSFSAQIQQLFSSFQRTTIEHRVVTGDGRVIPIEATLTLVRNENGHPTRLRGITMDVSDRYRSSERVRLLVEASKLFAETSDFRSALDRALHLLVPAIADVAQVFFTDGLNHVDRIAIVATSPELETLTREGSEKFIPREDTRLMIFQVLSAKKSMLLAEITDEFRKQHAISDEHLEYMRLVNMTSAILTPLFAEDQMFGVLTISRRATGASYTEEDKLFFEEFARSAAYAYHKARLSTEIEHELSRRTELQERLELMEGVSERVATSLNLQELLRDIAAIIVPRFADWMTIDLVDGAGDLNRIFIHHSDASLRPRAEIYKQEFGKEATGALIEIMRTGKPIFVADGSNFMPAENGISDERWQMIQELGAKSLIMVPLKSRRRTLGILGLEYGHSGRTYNERDVDLARDLAARIAAGIDNSLLFAEAHAEIERRIQLQRNLEAAKEDAEIASRTKDQFIATLSHELRTPLTPVLATVELLEGDSAFPEQLKPFLALVRRNIEIEVRLIDDLLDMTRITKGKMRMTTADIDLHALIPEVIEICRRDIDRAHLAIHRKFDLLNSFVRGDKDRLSQVFWNVIHNATKFTPEGGVITIETRSDGEEAVIEIRDTGHGIDRKELERIFRPFEQEQAQGRQKSDARAGLGLGLAISKSIVEMHGGAIEARSDGRGKGASFIIRLQALEVKQPEVLQPMRPFAKASGSHILFVDDHVDTNAALKVLLERRGYRVTTASSVTTGYELAKQHDFDLLVSDIGLPDGNGMDLLRLIRADEIAATRRPLKAIAVSGYGTDADIARSREAGFVFHLKKPIAFPDLERAISEALATT